MNQKRSDLLSIPSEFAWLKIVSIFISCIFISNCSVYSAITAPSPVNFKEIQLGEDRMNVISVLGDPRNSDTKESLTTDMFEFIDGYHGGYKVRVLPYLAADVFSVGLAEVILWPLEKYALEGSTNKAIISYNLDRKVDEMKVTKKSDGTQLYYIKDTSVKVNKTTNKIAPSPQDFEKSIPRTVTEDDLVIAQYFDKIPENWPQKSYYETEDFRYWSIPSDILSDQNEAIVSSKNKADMILSKEFPNKSLTALNYETTHMEIVSKNNKYRSWRLVRVPRVSKD